MKNEELVSVIMPVFNGFPTIRLSVASLLRQTYTNWECIIINDGSTDGTKEFLNTINDSHFVIHHFIENQGRPHARQKGLELARGEYIAMLDADDIYHPEKLAIQVKVMNEHPEIALVSSGICSFGNKVDFIRIRQKGDGKIHLYRRNDKLPIPHAPSMLRREYAVKFSYNKLLKLGQDSDFLRRYLDGEKYICLPNILYYYSEFDSVNKKKIIHAYAIAINNYFRQRDVVGCAKTILKFIYVIITFPFLNIVSILRKRGNSPSKEDIEDFEKYCKPYILL
jgi:glycosyltransferase involved in cell wall biosynthesis